MAEEVPVGLPPDQLDGLVAVLDLIRSGVARTRPGLAQASGLGRSVVAQRVAHLLAAGLVEESGLARSTGGRAPRELGLRAEAGLVLVAPLGANHVTVGVADLAGRLMATQSEVGDVGLGPDRVLARVEELLERVLADDAVPRGAPVYGVGVGVPGPVQFASGTPVSPPIMPGWDRYPIRSRLSRRYNAPVWVDNDVNLMALGELRAGAARGERDVILVKVGTGIGAGLVSGGRLHRGAQGCAGDIGHVALPEAENVVCRCGNRGCLEAVAGGAALAREGRRAAEQGRSPYLRRVLDSTGTVHSSDVTRGAAYGDAVCVELVARSARLVGVTLATLVNFFDPSLLLLGGGVVEVGDLFLAGVRETVYRRSLPLATRDLRIARATLAPDPGLSGAAFMVLDELFSREHLGQWIDAGSPVGHPELAGGRGPM